MLRFRHNRHLPDISPRLGDLHLRRRPDAALVPGAGPRRRVVRTPALHGDTARRPGGRRRRNGSVQSVQDVRVQLQRFQQSGTPGVEQKPDDR